MTKLTILKYERSLWDYIFLKTCLPRILKLDRNVDYNTLVDINGKSVFMMDVNSFDDLLRLDPPAISNRYGDHLHRPESGWISSDGGYVIGIGYMGHELMGFDEGIVTSEKMGFISINGYG